MLDFGDFRLIKVTFCAPSSYSCFILVCSVNVFICHIFLANRKISISMTPTCLPLFMVNIHFGSVLFSFCFEFDRSTLIYITFCQFILDICVAQFDKHQGLAQVRTHARTHVRDDDFEFDRLFASVSFLFRYISIKFYGQQWKNA